MFYFNLLVSLLLIFVYIFGYFFQKEHIYRVYQQKRAHQQRTFGDGGRGVGWRPFCPLASEGLLCWSVISIKLLCSVIEITLQHGYSPVNLLHLFRTTFPKNTSRWLLLELLCFFIGVALKIAVLVSWCTTLVSLC